MMDLKVPISNSNSDVAWHTDALQAVKLDPAVLEAQITVDRNSKKPNVAPELSEPSNVKHQVLKKPVEESNVTPKSSKFEDMMKMQKAALLSLAPQQFDLLLKYAEILRLQRIHNQKQMECAFCKKNGAPSSWYSLHILKDNRGRVRCPVLRGFRCPICGATGDAAHTIKFCPLTLRDRWSC